MTTRGKNLSQTVSKALTILETLADARTEMGVNELAARLGLDPSGTYRLLATLTYHGYVSQNPKTKKYGIGSMILHLSRALSDILELQRFARPILADLVGKTQETAHLMTLRGLEGVYVERVESPKTVRMVSFVGKSEPLHVSGVGKAIMAFLSEDEIDWIIKERGLPKMTENTITSPERLKKHLREIRQVGYAIDDEESEVGIRCIGAPVLDFTGRPVAGISVAAPAYRTDLDRLRSFAPALLEAASEISRRLGYERGGAAASSTQTEEGGRSQ